MRSPQHSTRLNPFKAPGPDGLHPFFFQRYWEIVGKSLEDFCAQVFTEWAIPPIVNQTYIYLIPKTSFAATISQYGPISLCNTVYKVITNIIVNRIKPYLQEIIGPKSSFLAGRRASDSALLVQEVLHFLKKRKGNKHLMMLKIDLEKAFDRPEWSFIHDTLIYFNFPSKIIRLIMSCICTSTISVLINGGSTPFFAPNRGIRQGNPLSPYIFILCMERLSRRIDIAVDHLLWTPIVTYPRGILISHLFFADDIILCGEINDSTCMAISTAMSQFGVISGQKINYSKSKIFFSDNTPTAKKILACTNLHLSKGSSFGKYLGFPMSTRLAKSDYQVLVDTFKAPPIRLETKIPHLGWEGHTYPVYP